MTASDLKLECLKIAASICGDSKDPGRVLKVADELYRYVLGS